MEKLKIAVIGKKDMAIKCLSYLNRLNKTMDIKYIYNN